MSIRKLLADGHDSSSVDALVIARLQVEGLYNFCFLIEAAENVRLFLRNGWKKQYVRFLLEREEGKHLARAKDFYLQRGPEHLERLRVASFVSDEQKRWTELEQMGISTKGEIAAPILSFPTPWKCLEKVGTEKQPMLSRLYPEYQWLCSFAHGSHEAAIFRTMMDSRSPVRHVLEPWKIFDVGQRQVAEPAVLYSALSCVAIATEVLDICPHDIDLAVQLALAWKLLTSVSLLSKKIWKIRAKQVLKAL